MSNWSYIEPNGPETWLEKFPEAGGRRQSPVDINPVDLKVLNAQNKLTWKYISGNTEEICNPGYSWKVHVNGNGSELRGGPLEGKYVLEQFHCHWGERDDIGSEHTVDGKHYAGELHLVHWNSDKYQSFDEAAKHPDGLCVLGIFLKPGRVHKELEKIVSRLNRIQFKDQHVKITEPVDPGRMVPVGSSYWTYLGSLTTPPCSECVIWIVFQDPIEVSNKQLEKFRKLKSYCPQDICPCDRTEGYVKNNFRPTLPLGEREIKECRQ